MTNELYTTMQDLRKRISKNGAVVRYSEKVFVVDGDEENTEPKTGRRQHHGTGIFTQHGHGRPPHGTQAGG